MQGKIIVIEGTDCSGKETQSKRVIERLKQEGFEFVYFSFPQYETPTGKIVGGPYLGKPHICEGWFPETAPNVDPKVSCLYYAADRKYNIPKIMEYINSGINVILDRYVYSNMAHQGGKLETKEERIDMYNWINELEFNLLGLPNPDIKAFLHVPYEASIPLKANRTEKLDQLESDTNHLIKAEQAYLEIAEIFEFKKIECTKDGKILSIDEINEILYQYLKENLLNKNQVSF